MTGHVAKRQDDEDEYSGPPPPDGGWGWMVVFGSFMIHIVNDGVTYSFGIFYDEFLGYFNEGKAATSWILSILVGVTLCSGPISSSFVNRWGCRPVTIAGALLASACLVISMFAQSVVTLYITIGLGTGFGFGLIYLPAIVSVTTYFEKKRSLATGIAVCGSGFGTFIFAPISNILIVEYGWRGATLIIAGLVLNCILFGALFRPLEFKDEKSPKAVSSHISLRSINGGTDIHIAHTDSPFSQLLKPTSALQDYDVTNIDASGTHGKKLLRPRSMGNFVHPLHAGQKDETKIELNGNIISNGKNTEISRLALSQPQLLTSGQSTTQSLHNGPHHISHRGPIYKPDIFYQGSLMNIPQYRSRNVSLSEDHEDEHLMQRHPSIRRSREIAISSARDDSDSEAEATTLCGVVPCSAETKDTLKQMLDFSLFKDPIFVLFTVSNFLTSIGFNVPYVYIVSRARELGISTDDASLLLAIIGIANTVGRIILGYVSDKPWVNRLLVYNMCLTICGVATALSAFCLDFTTMAIYASVFGFTIGAYVGLTSVILVDLLGLEKLTNAFGLLLLFQGIASFVGSPFAGMLYDSLGSYDPGFYMAGATMAGSGLILFAIPPIQKYRKKHKERSENL